MAEIENKTSNSRTRPASPCWYALQTRARHEKKVDAHLKREGLTTFLPLLDSVHQWSDRKQVVRVPLFPCYLFVHGVYSPEWHQGVLRKPGVLGFVGIGGEGLPIPDREIEGVRRLLGSDLAVRPYPFLNVGQRVRVREGALEGLEGIVVKNGGHELVLSVEMIQRSVAIRLESSYPLEVIG